MKFSLVRVSSVVLFFSLTLSLPSELRARKTGDDREVYITFVQGDVRVSKGRKHHPDLNQPWEQALAGEMVDQGCALVTGQGRAEIAFEDGSTVYLAENSLLLIPAFEDGSNVYLAENSLFPFSDRSLGVREEEYFSTATPVVSRLTLAAGTATFALQPAISQSFFIDTPTDHLALSLPETFFARIDAYLDATAITPQDPKVERVVGPGVPLLDIQQGETVFFQGGEILKTPNRNNDVAAILAGYVAWESLLPGLPDSGTPPKAESIAERSQATQGLASSHTQEPSDWDAWVSARVQQRRTATAAALKATGLSSPSPGLADLYEHGTFFSCEPYGTCWEATGPDEVQDDVQQSRAPGRQSPAAMQVQSNPTFQPQTVQWEELWQGWCSPPTLQTITRVAHTPEELQRLLRKKEAAQKGSLLRSSHPISCENGFWIPYRRHYARVLTPQLPRHCLGAHCKPIHAPRPVWVRVGNKVGLVPAHPNDVKGKPPINLKEGIIMPPLKPGERVERVTVGPSQKVTVMDKAPTEFRGQTFHEALRVEAPEIHAHLLQEVTRESFPALSARAASSITYDYKSRHFVMPASTVAGTKSGSREVAVGGIDSRGRIGSFADGHSSTYAQSFGRSEAAGSYRGGSFSAHGGYGGYGSGYSGGGHGSGYSGSYSGGSHSSGSSYGGGSSHSSSGGGGGWSSGSSSSSSSSSSSTGSSGGSHGKP